MSGQKTPLLVLLLVFCCDVKSVESWIPKLHVVSESTVEWKLYEEEAGACEANPRYAPNTHLSPRCIGTIKRCSTAEVCGAVSCSINGTVIMTAQTESQLPSPTPPTNDIVELNDSCPDGPKVPGPEAMHKKYLKINGTAAAFYCTAETNVTFSCSKLPGNFGGESRCSDSPCPYGYCRQLLNDSKCCLEQSRTTPGEIYHNLTIVVDVGKPSATAPVYVAIVVSTALVLLFAGAALIWWRKRWHFNRSNETDCELSVKDSEANLLNSDD